MTVKIATGDFPGVPGGGCPVVVDTQTGELRALIDGGGWLTDVRTAAVSVHAAERLATLGPLRIALLGAGTQAAWHIDAFRDARPTADMVLWGRNRRLRRQA